jgi:hypothetical protein
VPANAHNGCEGIADRGARVNCTAAMPRRDVFAALLVEYQGLDARAAVHYMNHCLQWDKFELEDLQCTEQSAEAKVQQSRRSSLAAMGRYRE